MSAIKCYLKCIENTHEPFFLENEREITIGRGSDTKIKDSRCSRNQIRLKAYYNTRNVKITQIGRNACGLNGLALKKDLSVTAKHGDRVEILLGQFIHLIEFEPPSPQAEGTTAENSDTVNQHNSLSTQNESNLPEKVEEIQNIEEPIAKKSRLDVIKGKWDSVDTGKLLIFTSEGLKPRTCIAAYDLDGTLIGTRSGKTFPKNKDDWKILFPEVLVRLKHFYEQSYRILIFTNQAGLSSGKQSINDFKFKIENVIKKINVPIQVFVATGYSLYRKPAIGMWEVAMERNNNVNIDFSKSFYCGDAAGREENYLKKKDFSQTDLLFAKNLDLNFETPEHHFLNKKMSPFKISVFDPKTIPCDIPLCEPSWGQVIANKLEVIILVGFPGSGKTHFAKTHLIPAGYVHISRDIVGTSAKCINAMTTALNQKQKVVIDNTNPDVESRKKFINVAKNYTPVVRCFVMKTSMQHAKHNNRFRLLTTPTLAVNDVVIHTFATKYEEPTLAEGFTEILKINFWLTFKNPQHEKLYKLFLLEK